MMEPATLADLPKRQGGISQGCQNGRKEFVVVVKSIDLYRYREVWLITAWRDGMVFKTKPTGKFILATDEDKIDRTKYVLSSCSTSLLKQNTVELEMFL